MNRIVNPVFFFVLFCLELSAAEVQPPPMPSVLYGQGQHLVALQASNGKWVAAEHGGDSYLIANRPHIQAWETFRLVCHTMNCTTVSLQAHRGLWVGPRTYTWRGTRKTNFRQVEKSKRLEANFQTAGSDENFTLKRHPNGLYTFQTTTGEYWGINLQTTSAPVLIPGDLQEGSYFRIKKLEYDANPDL